MTTAPALRILGFLSSSNPSEQDISDALDRFAASCGLDDSVRRNRSFLDAALMDVMAGRGLEIPSPARAAGMAEAVPQPAFSVTGSVAPAGGVENVTVEVLSVAVGRAASEVLASGRPNSHGEFALSFHASAPPVVRIRVSRGDAELYLSPPQRAQPSLHMAWSAADRPVARPGRFELRQALLDGKRPRGALRTVSDASPVLELSTLAAATGLPRAMVEAHVFAARLEHSLKIPAAAAFAILPRIGRDPVAIAGDDPRSRDGDTLPATTYEEIRDEILAGDPRSHLIAIERAVAVGEVASSVGGSLEAVARSLERAHIDFRLAQRSAAGATYEELLRAAGVEGGEVRDVARALLRGADDAAWASVAGATSLERSAEIRDALAIAAAVENDARVIVALRARGLGRARDLAKAAPSRIDSALAEIIPDAQQRGSRVKALSSWLDSRLPGATLLRRRGDKLSPAARRFIDAQSVDFDLRTCHVEQLLHDAGVDMRAPDGLAVREEISTLQRLVRVTKNGADAETLLDAGYTSAQQIALASQSDFARKTRLPEDVAGTIHSRARAHYRATVSTYLRANPLASGPSTPPIRSMNERATEKALGAVNLPSYDLLFGPQDYCLCEDCSSVTSPAAYLVDLLLWLKNAPSGGTASAPFAALLERRPDLDQILLNCDNTNVPVPYIDLVCELLEDEVAVRSGSMQPAARRTEARKRQTRQTADEIRAYPSYLNRIVYDLLAGSSVAMSLPFNLALAEIRGYVAARGTSWGAVLSAFGAEPTSLAAEAFGLGATELAIISTPKPDNASQQHIWGFDPTKPIPVDTFLRRAPSPAGGRAKASYDELLSLLSAQTLNRNGTITIGVTQGVLRDTCHAADRLINGADAATLDRIHRFLRLVRATPWSIPELDLLVSALATTPANPGIDADLTVRLRTAALLTKRLGVTAEELAYMFRDFSIKPIERARFHGGPALYARLFLPPNDATFESPTSPGVKLKDVRAQLRACLGISATELDALLAALGMAEANVGVHELAVLYRRVRLARALSRTIADLTELETLLKRRIPDPFKSPAELLAFIDDEAVLRAASLPSADARALIDPNAPSNPPFDALQTALRDLATRAEEAVRQQHLVDQNTAAPTDAEILAAIGTAWMKPLAEWLGLDTKLLPVLEAIDASGAAFAASLFKDATLASALRAARRAAMLASALRLGPSDVGAIVRSPSWATALATPSWDSLRAALRLAALTRKVPSQANFVDYLRQVATGTRQQLRDALAASYGLPATFIDATWTDLFKSTTALDRTALADAGHYEILTTRERVRAALGVDAATLSAWVKRVPDSQMAVDVRRVVQAASGEGWLGVSRTIQDPLRERRRDALIDYLLATAKESDPHSTDELYGSLLIDVEMADCRETARVVQAFAAVQLFVQRCFLGLESAFADLHKDDFHWAQWTWRKRYRLWEASRRIFLYPENYLDPARRSSATPLFKEFMKSLQQNDIRDEVVAGALDGYLAGLEEIANLDYATLGMDGNPLQWVTNPVKHVGVIGRTRGSAPRHYYRCLDGTGWSAWEELTLGVVPFHLQLAQGPTQAWLAWPQFTEYPHTTQDVPGVNDFQSGKPNYSKKPNALTYARFMWTVRDKNGAWGPVRTTSRSMIYASAPSRTVFVNAFRTAADLGDAFHTAVYLPVAGLAKEGVKVTLLGQMDVARDTTKTLEIKGTMAFGAAGNPTGEHAYELQRIDVRDVTAGTFSAWNDLVFDENRQSSLTAGVSLVVPKQTAPGGVNPTQTTLMKPPVTYATTVYPWVGGQPVADAFVVTTSAWSMLCLSDHVQSSVLGTSPPTSFAAFPMYHPFASELRQTVRKSLEDLYRPEVQANPSVMGRTALKYADLCKPTADVSLSTVVEGIEFDVPDGYELYNWELFYHVPMTVADQLRKNLRFEEAQRYLHFVFNPFTPDASASTPARYWVTKPFRTPPPTDEDIQAILASGVTQISPFAPFEGSPFDADAVARRRHTAYKKRAVIAYARNLLEWGDSLYRKGEPEDINESTQLYLLARAILGERAGSLRPLGVRKELAFADATWADEGNILVQLESLVLDAGLDLDHPRGGAPLVHLPLVATEAATPIKSLYFCVPPNDEMLGLQDTIAQRLDFIRHCKTIDGTFAPPPLLGVRIDPRVLADAAALGLSVADAIAMVSAKPPPYRFRVLLATAKEYCNEVKALGAALLQALEKRDAEHLARVRSAHEGQILTSHRAGKEWQQKQVEREIAAMEQQKVTIAAKQKFYSTRENMSQLEQTSFDLSVAAAALDTIGFVFDGLSGALFLIPSICLGISGFGGTPKADAAISGENIGSSIKQGAEGVSKLARILDRAATMTSTRAGYERRQEEWTFQAEQAALELQQLDKQIVAAKVRVEIAKAELAAQDVEEAVWAKMDELIREKFTGVEAYEWLASQTAVLYRRAYDQARAAAALAEACFRFEHGPTASFIGTDHWESLKHGLLAGERLARDLREMESAHLSRKPFDTLIVQHVALSQVAPTALARLKVKGGCSFTIPAWWIQRTYPHVQGRRIRSVAVSVPCVNGPYTSVNATLELRGVQRAATTTIHLSTGLSDTGWDGSIAADQYLPFEGASLDGDTSWVFGFPESPAAGPRASDVDFGTISDVVLRIEYTAAFGDPPVAATPPPARVLLELPQTSSDAWATLLRAQGDSSHACTLDVSDILPSLWRDYVIGGVEGAVVAIDSDGVDHGGKLTAKVVNSVLTITADTAQSAFVAWDKLQRILLVLNASPGPTN